MIRGWSAARFLEEIISMFLLLSVAWIFFWHPQNACLLWVQRWWVNDGRTRRGINGGHGPVQTTTWDPLGWDFWKAQHSHTDIHSRFLFDRKGKDSARPIPPPLCAQDRTAAISLVPWSALSRMAHLTGTSALSWQDGDDGDVSAVSLDRVAGGPQGEKRKLMKWPD